MTIMCISRRDKFYVCNDITKLHVVDKKKTKLHVADTQKKLNYML